MERGKAWRDDPWGSLTSRGPEAPWQSAEPSQCSGRLESAKLAKSCRSLPLRLLYLPQVFAWGRGVRLAGWQEDWEALRGQGEAS